MQLNLRKARKLESLIGSSTGVDTKFTSLSILASTNDEEASNLLVSTKKALQEQNVNILKLIEVQYSLRRKIEQTNEAVNIHELMNKREMLKKQIEYITELTNVDTCENKEMLDMLAAKRNALATGGSSMYDRGVSIKVSTLSVLEQEALEAQSRALSKQLEDVEEELLQKNVGAKLTLSAAEVEVLKSNGLV